MTIPFTGGCACGAIRYEVNAEPLAMFNCHCRDCQQATGGGFAAVVYVPKQAFRLTRGAPRHYLTPSLSGGHNKRGFCAQCGSRLSGAESESGIGLTAGSLDDASWFQPQFDIFTEDTQPWDRMDAKSPKFAQYPPSRG